MAEAYGYKVLFLSPYHPELNPIEYIWSTVKRNVARHAPYKTQIILSDILPMAFTAVGQTDFKNVFDHVYKLEEGYRDLKKKEVILFDQTVEIITQELLQNVQKIQKEVIEIKHLRKGSY